MIPLIKDNAINVLLVSYHTLATDFVNFFGKDGKEKGKEAGPPMEKKRKIATLYDLAFHRIVLDEAHTIRSSKTRFYKAVKSIQAKRKLGLTGTPFVNRAGKNLFD